MACFSGPLRVRSMQCFERGDHNDIQWTNAKEYLQVLTEFMGVLGSGV